MRSPVRRCSRLTCRSSKVGLITLDAHFDMRELDEGLSNGNPVRALMEDGLPGRNIAQIGLASFANTAKMHRDALAAGNLVVSIEEVRRDGIAKAVELAIEHMRNADAIVLDCDIDVIDRAQMPAAPGRSAGRDARQRFLLGGSADRVGSSVRVIDLTEWDPSLDPTDLSALTAARWVAECVAGFESRVSEFAAMRHEVTFLPPSFGVCPTLSGR